MSKHTPGRPARDTSTMNHERDTPETAGEFNEALGELIRAAFDNDVPVEGGWDVRNGTENADWTVEITRVEAEE